ncbi:MAG: GtrA family protein [Paludibacteraceae bacterium]|nr:GtrA family protein [Paludibacteraceae bacterium]
MKQSSLEWLRLLKFVLFSASAGAIQFASFALLNEFTGWRYWPCYLISLLLSILWNFTFNRRFTFKSNANITRAMILVLVFYTIFTPVTTILGDWLAEDLMWNEYVVTIINMLLNLSLEYLYQRYVVYRNKIDNIGK